MKTVRVNASKSYDVIIGHEILANAGQYIMSTAGGEKAVVVTDDTVDRIYSESVINSLLNSGYKVFKYVIPSGEKSKNASNFIAILNFLAQNSFSRKDVVIALGGGVVGDLAGFVAASYMRGIKLVQIPTTLLAAVDSSVGGKTAIDLDFGKNLAGAFYQPDLVLCDYDTLSTLSPKVLSSGCAEVIKYGVIVDKDLFNRLNKPIEGQLEDIIARCVEIKRDIVAKDEYDNGIRALLNFGHTIGHAIELLSAYEITHGFAVAVGMAYMVRAAVKLGFCRAECRDEIIGMVRLYNLLTETNFSADEIFNAAQSDKKSGGGRITVVIPRETGKCELKTITMAELKKIIELGIPETGVVV